MTIARRSCGRVRRLTASRPCARTRSACDVRSSRCASHRSRRSAFAVMKQTLMDSDDFAKANGELATRKAVPGFANRPSEDQALLIRRAPVERSAHDYVCGGLSDRVRRHLTHDHVGCRHLGHRPAAHLLKSPRDFRLRGLCGVSRWR